jgi:hypothetical protein
MTGTTGFNKMLRMSGGGYIPSMGGVFVGCLIIALMAGYAGLLMIGIGMNRMTVDTCEQ